MATSLQLRKLGVCLMTTVIFLAFGDQLQVLTVTALDCKALLRSLGGRFPNNRSLTAITLRKTGRNVQITVFSFKL